MTRPGRILALDLARTAAVIGMVVYHFTYDLDLFGYIPPTTATSGGWAIFARLVAGSFLFLAGVSLFLAHGDGIRGRAFLRRAAMLAAGALLISAATWFNAPEVYVFFGILHSILAASSIGLAFLRLPAVLMLGIAGLILLGRDYLSADLFNAPWLLWLGLSTEPVHSVDYEPIFPWFAPFLAGLALTRIVVRMGWLEILRAVHPPGLLARLLAFPGRHSLVIYLAHQPLLIGLFWAVTKVIR
jgi:uncharacterized membrane protein